MTHEAFLAAIRAGGGQQVDLLAYADWLEELLRPGLVFRRRAAACRWMAGWGRWPRHDPALGDINNCRIYGDWHWRCPRPGHDGHRKGRGLTERSRLPRELFSVLNGNYSKVAALYDRHAPEDGYRSAAFDSIRTAFTASQAIDNLGTALAHLQRLTSPNPPP